MMSIICQATNMIWKVIMKVSLNSDGHQFHWYQHNQQSPLPSNHWTLKKILRFLSDILLICFPGYKEGYGRGGSRGEGAPGICPP